jgi:hypothetical protein
MGRYMSGSQFGVKAGIRVGIFLALTLGFPFIVYGLILATGAGRVGGASGALAVVAGIYLKPVIVLVFLLSLISPCWKRMRSLGLPAALGLLVPFLFLMDAMYLMIIGTHWGVAFSLGVWSVNAPMFALSALAVLVAMSLAAPPPDGRTPGEHLGIALWLGAIVTGALVVTALLTTGMAWWYMVRIWFMAPADLAAFAGRRAQFSLSMQLATWATMVKPFVCMAFCATIAFMTFLSRRASSGQTGGGGETAIHRPVLVPSGTSAGVAFGKR